MGRKLKLKDTLVTICPRAFDLKPSESNVEIFSKELFNKLDILNTNHPISVVKTYKLPKWKESDKLEGKEILLPLRDPKNLGSVLRSCVSFNVDKIILLAEACNMFLPTAIKAANGAQFYKKIYLGPSIKSLKKVMVLNSNGGKNITTFNWPKKGRLLIGEEAGLALNAKTKTEDLHIPMTNGMDSLNCAVSASISLYSWINSK